MYCYYVFIVKFLPYHNLAAVSPPSPPHPDVSARFSLGDCSCPKSDFSETGGMISLCLYTMLNCHIKYLPSPWYVIVKQSILSIASFIRSATLLA